MPVEMQAKLLTVLEDKEIRRLGAEQTVKIDVRFLAATNRQPETLLQEQTLRNDLYYRLAMNRIDLPPLREHPEDIPALINATLTEFNEKNATALTLHPELIEHVQALPFPGNIRELKNVVWQIASESGQTAGEITLQMLAPELIPTLHSSTSLSLRVTPPPARHRARGLRKRNTGGHFVRSTGAMSMPWRTRSAFTAPRLSASSKNMV